jgi:hypothetical protein
LKTAKILNSTPKEAMMRPLEVAASLVELMQRRDQKLALKNLNVGGMAAILPCQFHEKKTKVSFQNPQDLEFDNQGGHDAPV